MRQFHTLKKEMKKVGGISLLDETFTQEFLTHLKLKNRGKYVILVNVLSSSDKSFDKAKDKVNLLVKPANVITLPKEHYNDHVQEFWMLRVTFMLISIEKKRRKVKRFFC